MATTETKIKTILAPAVFSAKEATRKALEIKSFMEEKIAAGQLQSQYNAELRKIKLEEQEKRKQEQMAREQKIAQKLTKEKLK